MEWVNAHLTKCLKFQSASRRFRPGEGLARGLLCNCGCETSIFVKVRFQLLCKFCLTDLEKMCVNWAICLYIVGHYFSFATFSLQQIISSRPKIFILQQTLQLYTVICSIHKATLHKKIYLLVNSMDIRLEEKYLYLKIWHYGLRCWTKCSAIWSERVGFQELFCYTWRSKIKFGTFYFIFHLILYNKCTKVG